MPDQNTPTSQPLPPLPAAPVVGNIPLALRSKRRWVPVRGTWEWKEAERRWKLRKQPIARVGGGNASNTQPEDWWTFESAMDVVHSMLGRGVPAMLFYVIDPDDELVFGDLDGVVNGTVVDEAAWADVRLFSYIEVSGSGTGLRWIARGAWPRNAEGISRAVHVAGYISITGNVFPGHATIREQQDQVEAFGALVGNASGGRADRSTEAVPAWEDALVPSGWELGLPLKVARMLSEGDSSAWDGDDSRAVFGVAHALFGRRLSPAQVLRVMVENPHTWAVATKPGRRSEGGASAVEWMWLYAVRGAIPPDPFEGLKERIGGGYGQAENDNGQASVDSGTAADIAGGGGGVAGGGAGLPGDPAGAPVPAADTGGGYEYDLIRAEASRLTHGDFTGADRVMQAMVQAGLDPMQCDLLVNDLTSKVGVKKTTIERKLKTMMGQAARARRAEQAGEMPDLESSYVYVETQDSLYSFLDHGWVSRAAVVARWGELGSDMLNSPGMHRVGRASYWPVNPWSSTFNEEQARWMTNELTGQRELNLWKAPKLVPKLDADDQDVAPWMRHIERVLGMPAQDRKHFLDYCAFTLQEPGRKINHMLLLGGESGVGKDTVLKPLQAGLGEHNVTEVRGETLVDGFDPNIVHAKLLLLQELSVGSRVDAEHINNTLKTYLASPPSTLMLDMKWQSEIRIPNLVNVVAVTNSRDAVHLMRGERRYFMSWCTGKKNSMDPRYAEDFHAWLDFGGGNEAIVGWLLKRDLSGFNPYAAPPVTDWMADAVDDQLTDTARYLVRMRAENFGALGYDVATLEEIHDSYMDWMRRRGEKAKSVGAVVYALGDKHLAWPQRRVNEPAELSGGRLHRGRKTFYVLHNVPKWDNATGAQFWTYSESRSFMG